MSSVPYRILRAGEVSEEEIADVLVQSMEIVGITGGSGCGKTSALDVLREFGALVLDADKVYHELLQTDEGLLTELREAFPEAFQGERLERRRLASIVFSDRTALHTLNQITHRYVGIEIRRRLRAHAMEGGTYAAIDAIELFNSGAADVCDWTMAVTAPEEIRIARITARDGISREAALARVRAQHPDAYFTEHCDLTVSNAGVKDVFQNQIRKIMEEHKWTRKRTA